MIVPKELNHLLQASHEKVMKRNHDVSTSQK